MKPKVIIFDLKEKWNPVIGYEDKYSISNLWRVTSHNYLNKKENKILSLNIDKFWRSSIKFSVLWKRKTFYIHRLVAIHFIENPDDLPCVLHRKETLDENWALYNWENNLWWGTHTDNMRDMFTKWRDNNVLKNKTWSILWVWFNKRKVNQYTKEWVFIKTFDTILNASKELKLHSSNITSVCKWKYKQTGWFIFKYKTNE